MTAFMCHINADKKGHVAFRISHVTGKCEIGDIAADAVQSSGGIRVYVKSGIAVQECHISPTIAYEQTYYHSSYDSPTRRYQASFALVDELEDIKDHNNYYGLANYWLPPNHMQTGGPRTGNWILETVQMGHFMK